jgi:hypothetical protein
MARRRDDDEPWGFWDSFFTPDSLGCVSVILFIVAFAILGALFSDNASQQLPDPAPAAAEKSPIKLTHYRPPAFLACRLPDWLS